MMLFYVGDATVTKWYYADREASNYSTSVSVLVCLCVFVCSPYNIEPLQKQVISQEDVGL